MVKDIEIPAVWKIVPEENCPPVSGRVWFKISVGIRAGRGGSNFPRTEIPHPFIQSSYAPAVLWKISKHAT